MLLFACSLNVCNSNGVCYVLLDECVSSPIFIHLLVFAALSFKICVWNDKRGERSDDDYAPCSESSTLFFFFPCYIFFYLCNNIVLRRASQHSHHTVLPLDIYLLYSLSSSYAV